MSQRLLIEDRSRGATPATSPVVGDKSADTAETRTTALNAADVPEPAVFPAPLTTVAAVLVGGLIGLASVYGVAERLADTLAGVAVIVMIFAISMAGPRIHAAARTEFSRTVAVVFESIAFGGIIGAFVILT